MSVDFGNFELISFDAERRSNGAKVKAHKYLGAATTPVELRLPDLPGFRNIKKSIVDDSKRDRTPVVVDAVEKHFDWEKGEHHHGGTIRVRHGDYVVCEDGAFFALPEKLFTEMFRHV